MYTSGTLLICFIGCIILHDYHFYKPETDELACFTKQEITYKYIITYDLTVILQEDSRGNTI